jgi:hypothetical protein
VAVEAGRRDSLTAGATVEPPGPTQACVRRRRARSSWTRAWG